MAEKPFLCLFCFCLLFEEKWRRRRVGIERSSKEAGGKQERGEWRNHVQACNVEPGAILFLEVKANMASALSRKEQNWCVWVVGPWKTCISLLQGVLVRVVPDRCHD